MAEASQSFEFVARPPACGVTHAWLERFDLDDLQAIADQHGMHVDQFTAQLLTAIIRHKQRDRLIANLLGT